MKFKAKVENKKVIFADKDVFMRELEKYEGKNITFEVKETRSQRSLNQNAYYWAVVIDMIATQTGNDKKVVHEYLKNELLTSEKGIEIDGKLTWFKTTRDSSDLNTKEFEQYLSDCRMWANTNLNILIPEPNQNYDYLLDY